jgi:hypothetical protein
MAMTMMEHLLDPRATVDSLTRSTAEHFGNAMRAGCAIISSATTADNSSGLRAGIRPLSSSPISTPWHLSIGRRTWRTRAP